MTNAIKIKERTNAVGIKERTNAIGTKKRTNYVGVTNYNYGIFGDKKAVFTSK